MLFASVIFVVGACLLGLAYALLKAWRLRTKIYKYDVSSDQQYNFLRSGAARAAIRLEGGTLSVPSLDPAGTTLLLELRIRSRALGHWLQPSVEIESPGGRWRQPFERGGSGLRYVDLTPVLTGDDSTLRLKGRHLDIPDQSTVLYTLKQGVEPKRQRMLVIGTHPDDAEIAAFGAYADRDAYVVTLTAGEAGDPGPFARFGAAESYLEKGRNRAWNSVAVPMLGGLSIKRTANLGYFDGTLQSMMEHPGTPVRSLQTDAKCLDVFGHAEDPTILEPRSKRQASWANLVADLEHLLKATGPIIIVAPYPRLDAHPDHKLSTVALIQALKNLNWREGSLLLYANHAVSSDHFPFGDAGDLASLVPGVDDVYFDSIVSVPLSARQQARKHMALDAMIDLRPDISVDSLRSVARALMRALKLALTDDQLSYFRQAVRANELFFEVRVSSLYEKGVTEKLLG